MDDECPHDFVLKTEGNMEGAYHGLKYDVWICDQCGRDFVPIHRSRLAIWWAARKMIRDLKGWDLEQ